LVGCIFQNGKKITSDIRYKTLEEDNTYTLLIIEAFPEDTGKYECVAINSAGEARCDAQLLVQQPMPAAPSKAQPSKPATPGTEQAPSVIEPLKGQVIREGQAVAFRCKISGRPGEQNFLVLHTFLLFFMQPVCMGLYKVCKVDSPLSIPLLTFHLQNY
jgi:hypothetical protein